jgi:hypothetical protein
MIAKDQTSMLLCLLELEKRLEKTANGMNGIYYQNTTLMKKMFEKGKSVKNNELIL